ncbi:hypothetical protein IQ269_13955 [Tychonema sp. LEGE 07199]|uniref:hypothetical protein n=1 Tax=unclassified Tychonema TaxID=2642144 RepID=UPI00187E4EFC|nr:MULTISPECIES: hypothetical protein [unclassified Tychonema]MBE9121879.1 hypothetical protein [Tychonema sp. LEGE 07199]MBE9134152.1 hypothetical protein [Tychonema sp. LEGE 07196]
MGFGILAVGCGYIDNPQQRATIDRAAHLFFCPMPDALRGPMPDALRGPIPNAKIKGIDRTQWRSTPSKILRTIYFLRRRQSTPNRLR